MGGHVDQPVFIIMRFVRAEREAEWLLHLEAFKQMLPYFFAAGHVHYARYGMCYLRAMEALPEEVLVRFMKGEHVMRHQRGLWNGLWSDMFIETTFYEIWPCPKWHHRNNLEAGYAQGLGIESSYM